MRIDQHIHPILSSAFKSAATLLAAALISACDGGPITIVVGPDDAASSSPQVASSDGTSTSSTASESSTGSAPLSDQAVYDLGRSQFDRYACSDCHGDNGEGTEQAGPLLAFHLYGAARFEGQFRDTHLSERSSNHFLDIECNKQTCSKPIVAYLSEYQKELAWGGYPSVNSLVDIGANTVHISVDAQYWLQYGKLDIVDAVANPNNAIAYILERGTGQVISFDLTTGDKIDSAQLAIKNGFLKLSDDGSRLYVAINQHLSTDGSHELVILNTDDELSLTGRIPLPAEPYDMALIGSDVAIVSYKGMEQATAILASYDAPEIDLIINFPSDSTNLAFNSETQDLFVNSQNGDTSKLYRYNFGSGGSESEPQETIHANQAFSTGQDLLINKTGNTLLTSSGDIFYRASLIEFPRVHFDQWQFLPEKLISAVDMVFENQTGAAVIADNEGYVSLYGVVGTGISPLQKGVTEQIEGLAHVFSTEAGLFALSIVDSRGLVTPLNTDAFYGVEPTSSSSSSPGILQASTEILIDDEGRHTVFAATPYVESESAWQNMILTLMLGFADSASNEEVLITPICKKQFCEALARSYPSQNLRIHGLQLLISPLLTFGISFEDELIGFSIQLPYASSNEITHIDSTWKKSGPTRCAAEEFIDDYKLLGDLTSAFATPQSSRKNGDIFRITNGNQTSIYVKTDNEGHALKIASVPSSFELDTTIAYNHLAGYHTIEGSPVTGPPIQTQSAASIILSDIAGLENNTLHLGESSDAIFSESNNVVEGSIDIDLLPPYLLASDFICTLAFSAIR